MNHFLITSQKYYRANSYDIIKIRLLMKRYHQENATFAYLPWYKSCQMLTVGCRTVLWYIHGPYCKNVKNSKKLLTIKMFFDCSSLAFNTNERKVKFVAVETWSPFIHVLRPQGWPKRPIKSWKFESVVPSEHGVDEIYSVLVRYRKVTPLFIWTISNHRIACPCFFFCFVFETTKFIHVKIVQDRQKTRGWKHKRHYKQQSLETSQATKPQAQPQHAGRAKNRKLRPQKQKTSKNIQKNQQKTAAKQKTMMLSYTSC